MTGQVRAHGTLTGYARGCRCDRCRHARAEYQARYRADLTARARTTAGRANVPHGTITGYNNHGCRCVPCSTAIRTYHQQWRRARRG